MVNQQSKLRVVNINFKKPMSLRIFDAGSGVEQTSGWAKESLAVFSAQIRKDMLKDGDVVHCVAYHKVHRCIRNYDRNEIHLYWSHLVGYDPVQEFKELTKDV